jgi:ABC-type phosphate transport system permease subunit
MVVQQLVQSILEFPGMIAQVAAQGPIQALLVLLGAVLIGLPVVLLGLFGLLWVAKLLNPSRLPTRRVTR